MTTRDPLRARQRVHSGDDPGADTYGDRDRAHAVDLMERRLQPAGEIDIDGG